MEITVDTVDEEIPEESPSVEVVAPVIVPENSGMAEVMAMLGELSGRLVVIEERASRAEIDAAQATADAEIANQIATVAIVEAEAAAIVAEEAATQEPVIEEAPEPDKAPNKQHWLFRERSEWGRK